MILKGLRHFKELPTPHPLRAAAAYDYEVPVP